MNFDSYFEIGYSHTICEDYALSGRINDDLVFAIVADGCSASADVDVGARLLAYSARQVLLQLYRNENNAAALQVLAEDLSRDLAYRIATQADCLRKQLLLPVDVLDSTLLIAIGDSKGCARFLCYGDGVAIHKNINGDVFYCNFEYPCGAPYYLSYLLDPAKDKGYREKFGRIDDDVVMRGDYLTKADNLTPFEQRFGAKGVNLYAHTSAEFLDTEWIVLMSDGATSYQQRVHSEGKPSQLESRDLRESLTELVGFKNFNGEFIKRKMNRLKKDHEKAEIVHYDDMSVAGIVLTK
jgi:hypothetical protein